MRDDKGTFYLSDAERVQREAEEGEFQLPSLERRRNLKEGDWAYIVLTDELSADDNDAVENRPGERFWVQVKKRTRSGSYVGEFYVKLIHYTLKSTKITFWPKHIYNILTAEQMKRSDRIYDLMGPDAVLRYQTEGYRSFEATSEANLDERLNEIETSGQATMHRVDNSIYYRPSLTNRVPDG